MCLVPATAGRFRRAVEPIPCLGGALHCCGPKGRSNILQMGNSDLVFYVNSASHWMNEELG